MAVNALSLAECLRPWRNAGLFHLLGDGDLQIAPQPAWEDGAEDRTQSPGARAPGPAHIAAPAQRPAASARARNAGAPERDSSAAARAARPAASATPTHDSGVRSDPAPEHWPGPWRELFARTRPAPLIWSYPELGDDLSGQGSPPRSAFLRSLLGDLRLPRGSSAFWPLRLGPEPGGNTEAAPQQDIFQEGLFLLRPKILILLGPRSLPLCGLPLSISHPFTQEITQGLLTVLLPDFSALLDNASQADAALTFLRAALSGMPLAAG